jgi:hypothetical protein
MMSWDALRIYCAFHAIRLGADIIEDASSVELILSRRRFLLIRNEDVIHWHITNLEKNPWFSSHGVLIDCQCLSDIIDSFAEKSQ